MISGEAIRKGFYLYDDRRKAKPDPEIKKYIDKARSVSGAKPDPKVSLSLSNNQVEISTLHLRGSHWFF